MFFDHSRDILTHKIAVHTQTWHKMLYQNYAKAYFTHKMTVGSIKWNKTLYRGSY